MKTYYCSECGDKLESKFVYTDNMDNYFCSEYCAMEYHGIEQTDVWPGNEDDNDTAEAKETIGTMENYYNACYASFGCITNRRYLIWGVEIADEIDTGMVTSEDVQSLIHKVLTSAERANAKPLPYEWLHKDGDCYPILGTMYKAAYVDLAYTMLHTDTLDAFSYDDNFLVLLDGDSGERGAVIVDQLI